MSNSQALIVKPQSIKSLLNSEPVKNRLELLLPPEINFGQMMGVFNTALRNPKLLECKPLTVLGAMYLSASLGLLPNTPTGEAFLVPFNSQHWDPQTRRKEWGMALTFMIGYKGYLKLAHESKLFRYIAAELVYPGEDFSFDRGTKHSLTHNYPLDRPGLANPKSALGGYLIWEINNGGTDFLTVPMSEILRRRDSSASYQYALSEGKVKDTIWEKHFTSMARKTILRQLPSCVPVSGRFALAATVDARGEDRTLNYAILAESESSDGSLDIDAATVDSPPLPQQPDLRDTLLKKADQPSKQN